MPEENSKILGLRPVRQGYIFTPDDSDTNMVTNAQVVDKLSSDLSDINH